MDFVDDLGGVALGRSRDGRGFKRWFWRHEAVRLRRFDRRIAASAAVSIAHSEPDAERIAPTVRTIPLAAATGPLAENGNKILFHGNLFYTPNHEAGTWICEALVPALARLGVEPNRLVVAGRRPRPSLRAVAQRAGIDFRPDVPDLMAVLSEATIVLAPMAFGAGSQYKVIDAVAAGRACILTGVANAGLGLVDGRSALVRERDPEGFAAAILSLLDDRALRLGLSLEARNHLAGHLPDAVASAWRAQVEEALALAGMRPPRPG